MLMKDVAIMWKMYAGAQSLSKKKYIQFLVNLVTQNIQKNIKARVRNQVESSVWWSDGDVCEPRSHQPVGYVGSEFCRIMY